MTTFPNKVTFLAIVGYDFEHMNFGVTQFIP